MSPPRRDDLSPEERAKRDARNAAIRERRAAANAVLAAEPPADTLDKLADDVVQQVLWLARGKLFGFAEGDGE